MKKLLWTEKNTSLRIGWNFFAKVQNHPTKVWKRLKTIAHQKETVFLTKPSWGVELHFFHQAEAFMPIVRFSPQILSKISRISKKITILFIFFMKKTLLTKKILIP